MSIGSEHQPSVIAYDQGYENMLQAYQYYKDCHIVDDQECVSYEAWKSRYGVITFDYRGQVQLFDKIEPFIGVEQGKDRLNKDIRFTLQLIDDVALSPGSDLKAIVTHFVPATLLFDKNMRPKRLM